MNGLRNGILKGLASGALILTVTTGAWAIDVSVGGLSGSVEADSGVDASASFGDTVSATSNTSVGGNDGLVDSSTGASQGDNGGFSASVGNGGVNTNVSSGDLNASIGTGNKTIPGLGTPGNNPGGNGQGGIFGSAAGGRNGATNNSIGRRALNNLSDQQIAVYRKRCVSILRDPNAWDYALVQMCKALRQAAAR